MSRYYVICKSISFEYIKEKNERILNNLYTRVGKRNNIIKLQRVVVTLTLQDNKGG